MSASTSKPADTANPMWGGHFSAGPAKIMEQLNASISFDKHLYVQDIAGSRAHTEMLVKQGILSRKDGEAILEGLDRVRQEIEAGTFTFSAALEDIHMNIESRLREMIGDAAGRMHTARSRNDQVATDFRLWVRDALDRLEEQLAALQKALITLAGQHTDTIMPGFTHLQTAQPVVFGHHLLAYVEMVGRDRGRVCDCRARMNESPLGAAALAGTPHPIDREYTASALGFDHPMRNSMDAVSDRDFAMEFLGLASIVMVHLSRLSEEIVIWMSKPFGFVSLSDAYTTGSSIMPQKRNPDGAELIRGKTGRVFGAFQALATVLKGLPLTYSKDMQEDKEPVFDAAETVLLCTAVMAGMVGDMQANPDAMRRATEGGFPTATDLADWLVRELGVPFRDAHHLTGQAVCLAEEQGCRLDELSLESLQGIDSRITEDVFRVLSVEASVASRTSLGGTAPERVKEAIQAAKERWS